MTALLNVKALESRAGSYIFGPGQMQTVMDGLSAAVYACDCDGLIVYYNAAAVQTWGRAPRLRHPADRYCSAMELFAPDGSPVPHDECWMALALRENKSFLGRDIVIERPDRTRLTVLAHASPLHDESGQLVGAVNVVLDITGRKRIESAQLEAEDALKQSEERFREVMETIEQVFWHARPDRSEILYVSPAYEKVWGRSCASLYASPMSWADAIHPEDRERVLGAACLQASDNTYQEEYRIKRPDGSMRWIRDRGFSVRNDQGEVIGLTGVAEDITERKQRAIGAIRSCPPPMAVLPVGCFRRRMHPDWLSWTG